MKLAQFKALKLWHERWRRPFEKNTWDAILTLWLMGWVGLPAAFLLGNLWAALLSFVLMFLPGVYVNWRRRLHEKGRLRCDWLEALEVKSSTFRA